MNIPSALVQGCNTPHGIGVLSDWIEEQTGYPPDFHEMNRSDHIFNHKIKHSYALGYGDVHGNGIGLGSHGYYSTRLNEGNGIGYSYYYGFVNGDGFGCGLGYGNSDGNGNDEDWIE